MVGEDARPQMQAQLNAQKAMEHYSAELQVAQSQISDLRARHRELKEQQK